MHVRDLTAALTRGRYAAEHSGPTPARAGSPTLVGRAAELALLSDHLAAPAPGLLLLDGEPGIGKSRLLAELAALARAAGRAVLAGRSYQAETVRPYGAWIDALRAAPLPELAEHRRADLALLLPELGPPPATADRHRLFDAVAEVIRGHRPPAVVILDDVQWLDEVSAALLHYLARAGGPALFALAARAGELEDNAPVLRVIRGCARQGRLSRRSIARLTAEETVALARQVAPGVDAGAVYTESAGNPLFVLEVARAGGAGSAGSAGSERLPPSLDGLIAERLAELDPRLVEIVGAAAALGTAFTLDGLGRALGAAPATLIDAVDELQRRGVLRAVAGGFDFEHDLVRRGAYLRLSPLRRRHLHLQIARGLEAVALGDGALAHHAALGGDHELAARACVAAGERALQVFAHAEAIALAQRGRVHLPTLGEPSRTVLDIKLLQVEVMASIAGRVMPGSGSAPNAFVDLRTELGRAAARARAAGLTHESAVAYRLLANLRYEEGDRDETLRYLDAAMEMGRDSDAASAAADLAMNGRCLAQLEGSIASARHCLSEAGAICAQSGLDLGELHWGLGLLARWDGDAATARTLLERALRCFRRDQDRWRECTIIACLAMLELELADAAALSARTAELGPMAARMGEGSELPFASALDALAARLAAAPDADRRLDAALDELRRVDSRAQLAYILHHAAALDLGAGRLADARRHAGEALVHAETVGRKSEIALARVLLAETARRAGATAEAKGALEPALALVAGADALPVRVLAAITAAAAALDLAIPTLTQTAASTRNR